MIRYEVQGMTCGGCEAAITRALKSAEQNAQVEADHKSASVSVDGIDAKRVQEIVEEAGFEFVGPRQPL